MKKRLINLWKWSKIDPDTVQDTPDKVMMKIPDTKKRKSIVVPLIDPIDEIDLSQ